MRIRLNLNEIEEHSSNSVALASLDRREQKRARREVGLNDQGNRRGMNPGSRAGQFKPGQSGNPHGSGGSLSLVALIKEELRLVPERGLDGVDNDEHYENAKLLVQRMVREAIDGNFQYAKEILDRVDGKPVVPISGPAGGAIEVRQEMKIIDASDIRPTLEALVGCGALSISTN